MNARQEKEQTAAEMAESAFSLIRHGFAFWKRSFLVFMLAACVAVPVVFLKKRAYRSETVVLYQENIRSADITGGEGSTDTARRVGARLKEMLLSRASLEPIVNDIPRYADLADRRGVVDAVEELRSHISFQAREGDTFEVGYEGLSPQEAQDITRRLGERIVGEAARQRAEQSKATKDYLEAQSEQNKTKLRAAEQSLWSFLTLHPEFIPLTLPGGGSKTVVVMPGGKAEPSGSKAPKGDPVTLQLESEVRELERQLKAAKGEPAAAPPSAPKESAAVAEARRELEEKRASFTEQHPDVVAAKRRLQAAIEADQRAAAPKPVRSEKLSEADIAALEQRLAVLRRSIASRRAGGASGSGAAAAGAASSAATVALEVEFRRLQREVEYLKEAQRQLDDKLFKAGLNEGASLSDRNIQVKILDPAYLPAHPSSKPRSKALAIYLGIGMVLAILVALLSARLDDRIYQRRDLEILGILPVVGVIPRQPARKHG